MKKLMVVLTTMGMLAVLTMTGCGGDGTGDGSGPSVVSTSPVNGAEDVAVDTLISVTFDEDIDCSGAGLTLSGGEASTVACDGVTATFTPGTQLATDTEYTATVSGVKNLAGEPTEADHTWGFATGVTGDTIAPALISTLPAADATDVAVNTSISATFDEDIECLGIVLTLSEGETSSAACDGATVTFTPNTQLTPNTAYTTTISGVTDLAGNPTATNATWDFTTGTAGDTVGPSVISTSPLPGAIRVPASTPIFATFDEEIDCSGATFSLSQGMTGSSACDGATMTFSPGASLALGTQYTATISGVADLVGNPMASSYEWSFTIELRISDIAFGDPRVDSCVTATGYTYPDEITILECDNKGIDDISGIEHFTSLRNLSLNTNNITDLTPLTDLTSLTILELRENNIASLTPLSGHTNLLRLYLDNNSISNLTPLSELANLDYLHMNNNTIADLTPLSGLTGLVFLDLGNNNIVNPAPLAGLTVITTLYLNSNNIIDVTQLRTLTSLERLPLQANSITTGVAELVTLTSALNINLSANENIPCADLDTLEAALGANVVNRPFSCQ